MVSYRQSAHDLLNARIPLANPEGTESFATVYGKRSALGP